MPPPSLLHLAAAIDGAGWHPAAWREPDARPADVFSPGYWVELTRRAEKGGLDFVTIEDGLALQSAAPNGRPDGRTDRLRGRLDAVLIAARVAPLTRRIGLVPSVTVTHTEPFHISKAIATLDFVSTGRAGVRVQVSGRVQDAEHFGRRTFPEDSARDADPSDLLAEAGDYVEVVRRLWDSWEDDAEIRDAATGRFIDREKLHYIDFEGRWFRVRGPSITPRPPQGQPLVTALAHSTIPYRFAAQHADVVYVTPRDREHAATICAEVFGECARIGRPAGDLRVFADLVVFLDGDGSAAAGRKARLDALDGTEYRSDALVFAGTPVGLADLMADWQAGAGIAGFRLRPGAIPHDLDAVTEGLVPELRRRGLFGRDYEASTLRGHLGFDHPANRYASV
jgi:alkanesulfonate monooxygenase SsuD/methylene tetrahydromethanopterin reductase-like flavin-dependent oxidoreductase (luciferase family)